MTVTTQLKYSGSSNNLSVQVSGVVVGTIAYSSTVTTTKININVPGNVVIKLINPISGNRVAIDDLSWTCYSTLRAVESVKEKSFSVYPNPVKNHELFVKGDNLNKILKAEIYDVSGKLIQTIKSPFRKADKINIYGIKKGTYILKTDNTSAKFIVD